MIMIVALDLHYSYNGSLDVDCYYGLLNSNICTRALQLKLNDEIVVKKFLPVGFYKRP